MPNAPEGPAVAATTVVLGEATGAAVLLDVTTELVPALGCPMTDVVLNELSGMDWAQPKLIWSLEMVPEPLELCLDFPLPVRPKSVVFPKRPPPVAVPL